MEREKSVSRGLLDVQHVLAAALLGVHKPVFAMASHDQVRLVKLERYGMMSESDVKRILSFCNGDIFGDDCVMWTGGRVTRGGKGCQHGRFSYRSKLVSATRLLYHNYVEPLTTKKPFILHSCDTDGRCVCLKHLRAGTGADNYQDMVAMGNVGGNKKLSEDDVRAIRKRYRDGNGETQTHISLSYPCVIFSTISRVCNRTTWKNVE